MTAPTSWSKSAAMSKATKMGVTQRAGRDRSCQLISDHVAPGILDFLHAMPPKRTHNNGRENIFQIRTMIIEKFTYEEPIEAWWSGAQRERREIRCARMSRK